MSNDGKVQMEKHGEMAWVAPDYVRTFEAEGWVRTKPWEGPIGGAEFAVHPMHCCGGCGALIDEKSVRVVVAKGAGTGLSDSPVYALYCRKCAGIPEGV